MKNYLFLFLLMILISKSSRAQENTTVYCKLTIQYKNNGQHVTIDFGNNSDAYIKDTTVVADLKKVRMFDNGVDAMNYMSTKGWELIQVFYVPYMEYDCFLKKIRTR